MESVMIQINKKVLDLSSVVVAQNRLDFEGQAFDTIPMHNLKVIFFYRNFPQIRGRKTGE
jgi:hypothetical protein